MKIAQKSHVVVRSHEPQSMDSTRVSRARAYTIIKAIIIKHPCSVNTKQMCLFGDINLQVLQNLCDLISHSFIRFLFCFRPCSYPSLQYISGNYVA